MASSLAEWLERLGLGKYADVFAENEIDLDVLPDLTEDDLKGLGLPLGPRRKIGAALNKPSPEAPVAETSREGERRQVTVLFADLAGFTRMSTELDAEEVHLILNRYFAVVDGIVTEYGGRIDKHIGDAVMAVFGAPFARTDDPERAVRAACDIHRAIAALGPELKRDLAVHIGIASGQVVASDTGSDRHHEYTVTGETVNLASRLDDLAEAGETLISRAVHAAVAHVADCSARGEVAVQGLSAPVAVWSVDRIAPAAPAPAHRVLIGRSGETRQFRAFLDECTERRRGQTILLRGDPGIGKTCLAETFIGTALANGFAVHRSLVLDFGAGKGQDPFGTLVRSLLSVAHGDGKDQRGVRLDEAIAGGMADPAHRVFLNDLLDLPHAVEQQGQYDAMDGATRKAGKAAAIARLVASASDRRPVLIVFEDIHWADAVTIDWIRTLARSSAAAAVIMILTTRPEGPSMEPGWIPSFRGVPLATVELGPLPPDETMELALHLDHGASSRIAGFVARSEGNPLILEQLLRNSSEVGGEEIPGTLRGLVQARVDRLPNGDRQAIKAASVIGQRFSLAALRAILARPDYDCALLLEHRLIRPDGHDFLFDHALIRDAVYVSLLAGQRQDIHLRAAGHFAGREPLLHAEHLDKAAAPDAALAYLAAAEAETAAYRTERAMDLAQRGLALARSDAERFLVSVRLAEWQLDAGAAATSIETLQSVADLADSEEELCRVEIGLASGLRLVDRQSEALTLLDTAETRARTIGAGTDLARLHHLRGNLMFMLGRHGECQTQHQLALEAATEAGSVEWQSRALGGLADAAYAHGRLITANRQFARCVDLAEQAGLGRVAVANRSMLAITGLAVGDVRRVRDDANAAIRAAREVAHMRAEMIGHHSGHQANWCLGDAEACDAHITRAHDLAQRLGSHQFTAEALVFRAEILSMQGDADAALDTARQALDICRAHGMAFIGPMALGRLAAVAVDAAEREAALAEGEALLARGSLSHNHVFFRRDAIEAALDARDWDAADRHADALQAYTAAEPMPIFTFAALRGHALAAHGRGDRSEAHLSGLRALLETARRMELRPFEPKLAAALAQAG